MTWKEEGEEKVLMERISNCCLTKEGIVEDRTTPVIAQPMDARRVIIA